MYKDEFPFRCQSSENFRKDRQIEYKKERKQMALDRLLFSWAKTRFLFQYKTVLLELWPLSSQDITQARQARGKKRKKGNNQLRQMVVWYWGKRARERKCGRNRVYAGLCTFQLPPNPDRADPWPTEADKGVLHKINKANKSTLNVHKQISKWSSSELFVALAIQIYVELRGQGIVDHFLLSRKN